MGPLVHVYCEQPDSYSDSSRLVCVQCGVRSVWSVCGVVGLWGARCMLPVLASESIPRFCTHYIQQDLPGAPSESGVHTRNTILETARTSHVSRLKVENNENKRKYLCGEISRYLESAVARCEFSRHSLPG